MAVWPPMGSAHSCKTDNGRRRVPISKRCIYRLAAEHGAFSQRAAQFFADLHVGVVLKSGGNDPNLEIDRRIKERGKESSPVSFLPDSIREGRSKFDKIGRRLGPLA